MVLLAALIIAGTLAGVTLVLHPEWGAPIALWLVVSNVLVAGQTVGLPTALAILPYAVLAVSAFAAAIFKGFTVVISPVLVCLVVFIFVGTLSAVFSFYSSDTAMVIIEWIAEGVSLCLALPTILRDRRSFNRGIAAVVSACAFVGALVLYQNLTGTFEESYFGLARTTEPYDVTGVDSFEKEVLTYRSAGMLGEPNFFAMYTAAIAPWALYLAWQTRNYLLRVVWLVAGVAIMAGVMYSYSRGALVAIGGTVFLLAVVGVLPRRSLLWLAAGGAVVATVLPTVRERLLTLVGIGSSVTDAGDVSSQGRLSEIIAAIQTALTHPIIGVGPGQFPHYYQRYGGQISGGAHTGDGGRLAHNLFAGIAAEMGILGVLVWTALFITAMVPLWRHRRGPWGSAAVAGLTSLSLYLVAGAFLHLAYARYIWLLLAIAATVGYLAAKEQRARSLAATHAHPASTLQGVTS